MLTDALSDFIRTVDDDSAAKDKVIFVLWSAIDDALEPRVDTDFVLRRGLRRAAELLAQEGSQ